MKKLSFIGLLLTIVAMSSAHAQSISSDGSILLETLTTSDGTWTFGAPYPYGPAGNWYINLNGQSAAGGVGSEMVVANGGMLYALGTDSNWYLWVNGGWMRTSSPTLAARPAMPLTVPSPDGSVLVGSLQTLAGTWTFGAAYPWAPGNWYINLNGQSAAGGIGSELVVANDGQVYALGTDDNWYVWQNGAWYGSANPLANSGPSGPSEPSGPNTVVMSVGPGGQYQTIAAAAAAADADSNPGNYYDIRVMPGTYTNDFPYVTRPMTIEVDPNSAGGPVVLNATVALPNQKGIILTVASLTVNGLTFTGAQIDNSLGGNGAGIRDQNTAPGATLTILNSTFAGNQEGILTGANADQTVTVMNSNFVNNGNPDINYFQHALYVGAAGSLTVSNSLFCGQLIGHNIKSRAQVTTISGNQIYDGAANAGCNAGSSSLAIDVPNGGVASISGNQIIQGATSQNNKMVDYGEEGLAYGNNSLVVSGNSFTNSGISNAVGIWDPSCMTAQLSNNTFIGITTMVDPANCAVFTEGGPISPDGTVLTAGSNGSLTTAAGTWSFGGPAPRRPGEWLIVLNGSASNGGISAKLEVANRGQMYALTAFGTWWVWNNGWSQTAAP